MPAAAGPAALTTRSTAWVSPLASVSDATAPAAVAIARTGLPNAVAAPFRAAASTSARAIAGPSTHPSVGNSATSGAVFANATCGSSSRRARATSQISAG